MSSDWQPIETAPRDGSEILCYWPSYAYLPDDDGAPRIAIATWAVNDRIARAHAVGEGLEYSVGYFHDTDEADDVGLAHPAHAPSHWMPLPRPPS